MRLGTRVIWTRHNGAIIRGRVTDVSADGRTVQVTMGYLVPDAGFSYWMPVSDLRVEPQVKTS